MNIADYEAWDSLSERQRECISILLHEPTSTTDVMAELLGCKRRNVNQVLYHARVKLGAKNLPHLFSILTGKSPQFPNIRQGKRASPKTPKQIEARQEVDRDPPPQKDWPVTIVGAKKKTLHARINRRWAA